jgi:L-alanine-DL-glutamate epimerase-like enolase superfamily enzyme
MSSRTEAASTTTRTVTDERIPCIESIDVEVFRVPLPEGPWGDQIHHVTDIEVTLVTVHGSNGLTGIGASHTSGMGGATIGALAREIAPVLIGQPLSPRALWGHAYRYVHDIGGAGVTTHAISAFDIAFWDLLGKSYGVPVIDLLGRVHDRVALYGSGINLHLETDEVIDQVKRWQAKGYAFGKVKVGKPDLEEDVERLAKLRAAIGSYPIAVDANQGWSFPQAVRAFHRFEQFNLLWIEEPLPSDDILGHARLRARTTTPIGLGENVYTADQFNQYFEAGIVDFVQADVGRVGGITGFMDIATLARVRNLPMTPHFVLELSASLLAAVPNACAAEVTDGGRWQDLQIVKAGGTEHDGYYYPSPEPGTGLIWDLDYLAQHRIAF